MKGSLRIITFANIPVYIHWSFSFVFLYILYVSQNLGLRGDTILFVSAVLTAIFLCVILHEFGHALTARRFGVETKDIILLPIGGIARLTQLPEKPVHEFWVALAGPLVNVVVAILLCSYFFVVSPENLLPYEEKFSPSNQWLYFIPFLIGLNITLALFNLIPAFPLDGGRIFRALLSIKLGRKHATQIASFLGQIMAVIFLVISFYTRDITIGFIAIFVYFTASREYSVVKTESKLQQHPVAEICRTSFTILPSSTTIEETLSLLKTGLEKWFLVEKESHIIGIIKEDHLLKAIKKGNIDQPIELFLDTTFKKISTEDSLKKVYQLAQVGGYEHFPVYENEVLVGVIDTDGVQHFLKLNEV